MTSPLAQARDLRDVASEDPDSVDLEAVLQLLHFPDRPVQREAVSALHAVVQERPSAGTEAVDRLAHLLETADADEGTFRERILRCLAQIGAVRPEEVHPVRDPVLDCLDAADPTQRDEQVHAAATVCLAQLASDDPSPYVPYVERFGSLLATGAPSTRRHVAHVLVAIGEEHPTALTSLVPTIRDVLDVPDTQTVTKATATLGLVAAERPQEVVPAIPALADLLDHEDVDVRANAVGALADVAPEASDRVTEIVPEITPLLDDSATPVRRHATATLRRLAEEGDDLSTEATGGLVELLDDPDSAIRREACTALGYLEAPIALSLLQTTATDDPDPAVRESAEWAIEQIQR